MKKKKKDLRVIDVEFVKNNQCKLPTSNKIKTIKTDSWFDIRRIKDSNVTCKTDVEKTENESLRVERIELYPDMNQKIILLRWFEVYRRLYNFTVANRSKLMKGGYMVSDITMRNMVFNQLLKPDTNLAQEIKESKILVSSIRNAIKDVRKAFDSAMANKKAGNIRAFRLRYKKQSNPTMTLVLDSEAFSKTKNGFAIRVLDKMRSSEPFGKVSNECRLSYNSNNGRFVLWKPYMKETVTKDNKHSIIALDPGLRSFQTGYSPDGLCVKIANVKYQKHEEKTSEQKKRMIDKNNNKIKYLIKKIDTAKKLPNRNIKKYLKRLRCKLTNMVTDLHWKTAKYLCENYKTILIGNMSTTGIVKKSNVKLTALDKKFCIQLSHYKFRERLASKAEEHGVKFLVVDESYTTQTCGKCGVRNIVVGGDKIFKCSDDGCDFRYDRDYNGARNIYLKSLSRKLF